MNTKSGNSRISGSYCYPNYGCGSLVYERKLFLVPPCPAVFVADVGLILLIISAFVSGDALNLSKYGRY